MIDLQQYKQKLIMNNVVFDENQGEMGIFGAGDLMFSEDR